jgi:SulP family sulfate permease
VQQGLEQNPRSMPRFVALDFRLVTGLDTSAVFSFARMKQLARKHHIVLVFTHLSPKLERQLAKDIFQPDDHQIWRIFPDLDRGVEWCEAQFLETLKNVGFNLESGGRKRALSDTLPIGRGFEKLHALLQGEEDEPTTGEFPADSHPFDLTRLKPYLPPLEVAPGDILIRQGEAVQKLCFIDTGQVTIQLEQLDGQTIRLSTMGAGAVVGELSFYLGTPASASVIVDQPGQVYLLSMAKLNELAEIDPHLKAALHEFMAYLLSERLCHANATLQALLQ